MTICAVIANLGLTGSTRMTFIDYKKKTKKEKYINGSDNSGALLTNFSLCLKSNEFDLY